MRHGAGPTGVTVDDDDVAGPEPGDGGGGQRAHAPGADDEHVEPAEPTEDGLGAGEPGLDEGAADQVDLGLGVDPLGHPQGLLEQRVERGADVAVGLGVGERAAHLAEDLGLADRHRVQPGGHGEGVGDAAVLVVDVEVRLERGPVDPARGAERRRDVDERAVEGEALARTPRCGCTWRARPPR